MDKNWKQAINWNFGQNHMLNMKLAYVIILKLFKLSNGLINCEIKNQQPKDLGLSQDTISATKRKESDFYQV